MSSKEIVEFIVKVAGVLGILGVPSVTAIALWCVRHCMDVTKKLTILMKAVQASMRTNLLNDYNKFKAAGYIQQDDLDEWLNRYESYHALGQNGVLDRRKEELLTLPTTME